jgi:hypothetical protein
VKLLVIGAVLTVAVVVGVAGYFGSSHGPNCTTDKDGAHLAQALNPKDVLPVGPLSNVSTQPYPGAVGNFKHTFFILGDDSPVYCLP